VTPDQSPAPVPAERAAAASITFDELRFADDRLLWLESRPSEDGRSVLVDWGPSGGQGDAVPEWADVGSAVYGYGGGSYTVAGGAVWFCHADGRIWRSTGSQPPSPVTPPAENVPVSYGDLWPARGVGDRLLCVREHDSGGDGWSDIVVIDADTPGQEPRRLTGGWDFHAHPRPDPDGRRLAWLTWSDPLLPWDGTWLWTADLTTTGDHLKLGEPALVAGGPGESVLQPTWAPDGHLHFLSDRSGWWNLYRHHNNQVEAVLVANAEMAAGPWELGYATYAFLPAGRIAVVLQNGPRHRLAIHDPATGTTTELALPYSSSKPYLSAYGDRVALIGASPTQAPTVAVIDTTTGHVEELAAPPPLAPADQLSTPDAISLSTRDGSTAHGLYYPPTNARTAEPRRPPPVIIRPHPGPTANTTMRLDPAVQFFTSHGYAVLDLDYRGSTGYGRAYRQALNGHWGILDVTDCVDAADYLTASRLADPDRLFISGASAGGYTALRALATTTRFAAGTARSAIADPAGWRDMVPRFQRHHTTDLIGPVPAAADRYEARSALHAPERIGAPLLLLHGERDPVAPVGPIRDLATALREAGRPVVLVTYPDEGHILGKGANIADALSIELAHYEAAPHRSAPTASLTDAAATSGEFGEA
jgi:dipeptidyl aminopeptidase/acylaminoacyl peptidase